MGNRQRKLFKNCRSKIKYASRADALAATQQGRLAIERLDIYSCQHCGGWHLGHSVYEPDSRRTATAPGAVGFVAPRAPRLRTPLMVKRQSELRERRLLTRAYSAQERDDDGD